MRKKLLLAAALVTLAAALVTLAAASATHAYAASYWYAACGSTSHAGYRSWFGDNRSSESAAQADCNAHVAANSGHTCVVWSGG